MAGFTSESVAAFRRNGWPTCVGISGRLGSEYAQDDMDGALDDYTEAIRINPDHAGAYDNRARVLLANGDKKAAQRDLDKVKLLES